MSLVCHGELRPTPKNALDREAYASLVFFELNYGRTYVLGGGSLKLTIC